MEKSTKTTLALALADLAINIPALEYGSYQKYMHVIPSPYAKCVLNVKLLSIIKQLKMLLQTHRRWPDMRKVMTTRPLVARIFVARIPLYTE